MPTTARHDTCDTPGRSDRVGPRVIATVVTLLLGAGSIGVADAQSAYGCEGLDRSPIPAVEGKAGTFFRIDPDLLTDTRLPAPLIGHLATISRNLAARGTQLVYVPVPAKGLVQAEDLGIDAERFGYDVRLARALYADSMAHLRSAGIVAVDAAEALTTANGEEPAFFPTDPRMSNEGLRLLAQAIADEVGDDLAGMATFTTRPGEVAELDSRDRFRLQLSCQAELPKVLVRQFATTTETPIPDHAPIVVVSSTITTGDSRNFPGFLAQALRRPVARVVSAESAHAAMAAYLTSDDFARGRPEAIIWLVPIWQNPALRGDQPMREIAAATANKCGPALTPTETSEEGYQVDLPAYSAAESLRLDTGGTPIARVAFRFGAANGHTRVRRILRSGRDMATSIAFMPLSGLWPEGATHVTIEIDADLAAAPTLSICRG